jgi:hypothetical protein
MLFIASYQGIIIACAPVREHAITAACKRYAAVHGKPVEPGWLEVVCLHHVPGGRAWVRNVEQLLP